MTEWYSEEEFWKTVQPFMLTDEKMENAAEEVEQLLSLVDVEPEAAVLDMPCGTGRHSLELAERGFDVTGVDITGAYLQEARKQAEEQDLDIELLQRDMREFDRQNRYSLAINLFTSFGYFDDKEDDRKAARSFYEALKPGGILVIEILGKELLARDYQQRTWAEKDEGYLLEERNIADDWSKVENRWIAIRDGNTQEFDIAFRLYSATELTELLHNAGFQRTEIYGNFQGDAYGPDADRLVVIAHKESAD